MNRKDMGSHQDCVMCGEGNPFGMKLKFKLAEDGVASAAFKASPRYQGYDGILHGGVISAILDSAMTNCLFLHGVEALTGKLEVRFLKPVPCDSLLSIFAELVVSKPPFHKLKACAKYDDAIMAEAEAKFMETRKHGLEAEMKPFNNERKQA